MLFSKYCQYLESFENMNSRNAMVEELAQLLKELKSTEINGAIYMLQGMIAPLYVPMEFNFSTKMLIRTFIEMSEESLDVNGIYAEVGDIGILVEKIFAERESGNLEVFQVFEKLKEIALISGKDSQKKKAHAIKQIRQMFNNLEYKYFTRIVVGKLRLGLSDKTILEGISWAVAGDKSLKTQIESAFGAKADLGLIATAIIGDGVEAIEHIDVEAGVPVAAKLVEREKRSEDIFERLGECVIQPKLDGLRLQIHFRKDGFRDTEFSSEQKELIGIDKQNNVRMFSRNMSAMGFMFPDVEDVIKQLNVDSVIIDSEVIGFDEQTGDLLPFQQTIQRKRKTGVVEAAQNIPVKIYSFDILELNGESLTKRPLLERLEILDHLVKDHSNLAKRLVMVESPVVKSAEELENKFMEYVNRGLEGIIAKEVTSVYAPGTRNYDWIKLKAKSQKELVDSVDAVVLGYYNGRGARAKFGIGALLLGTYDPSQDKYLSLTKLGTGVKDEQWVQIKQKLDQLKVSKVANNVIIPQQLVPDAIVAPDLVVTVEADEITKSVLHSDTDESTFSLRFPRLIEFDRDKSPNQITSIEELQKMFDLQYKRE